MNFQIYMKKERAKLKSEKFKNYTNLISQTLWQTWAQNIVGKNLDKLFGRETTKKFFDSHENKKFFASKKNNK